MSQLTTPARLHILHATGSEYLRDALSTDLLTAEAQRQCESVLAQNESLHRENAALISQNAVLNGLLAEYRATHRQALDGRVRRWRLLAWGTMRPLEWAVVWWIAGWIVTNAIWIGLLI